MLQLKLMISAVVLTHNNEATLPRTLDSLTWCDEIVVVDDVSTDKTLDIAKTYKAVVVKKELMGDFAAQRNAGLKAAKGDWVLFVDSDEVVTPNLQKEIQNVMADSDELKVKSEKLKVGYYIKRRDWMWGKPLLHGETASVKLLRLARKEAGKWARPVHEVWDVTGVTGELQEPLEHYPHPTVAEFLTEVNAYSTVNAHFLYNAGVKASWWHIIAYPKAKFFVNYFCRLGFLDGAAGMVHALMMSFHSFLTRAKLWQLYDKATIQQTNNSTK